MAFTGIRRTKQEYEVGATFHQVVTSSLHESNQQRWKAGVGFGSSTEAQDPQTVLATLPSLDSEAQVGHRWAPYPSYASVADTGRICWR